MSSASVPKSRDRKQYHRGSSHATRREPLINYACTSSAVHHLLDRRVSSLLSHFNTRRVLEVLPTIECTHAPLILAVHRLSNPLESSGADTQVSLSPAVRSSHRSYHQRKCSFSITVAASDTHALFAVGCASCLWRIVWVRSIIPCPLHRSQLSTWKNNCKQHHHEI